METLEGKSGFKNTLLQIFVFPLHKVSNVFESDICMDTLAPQKE